MHTAKILCLPVIIAIVCLAGPLHAWTDHALIAYGALGNDSRYSDTVPCEPIEKFLEKEKDRIGAVLDESEKWGKSRFDYYPVLPDTLRFSAGGEKDMLKRFVKALRINPRMRFQLYVHPLPGTKTAGGAILPWETVSIIKADSIGIPFPVLKPGDKITAREILATGCDEPDYGYDMFLWEDNGTEAGREYGLGKQPFGNPAIEYATQAPFHMGFYHESWILYKLAPMLKKTYPEFRIHQYTMLSKLAFETGHRYWGYRFAGMALHYIHDLTNPYHATVVPGASVFKVIFASILDVIGIHGPREKLLKEVSDFHILIEKIQNQKLKALLKNHEMADPLVAALGDDSGDRKYPAFDENMVRTIVTVESHDRAGRTKSILNNAVFNRPMFEKIQKLDAEGPYDVFPIISGSKKEALADLDGLLADVMRSAGVYTRMYLKTVVR